MARCVDPLNSVGNNLSNNASAHSTIQPSFESDFIPRYHQNELVSAAESAGKVIFLPREQDKLHFVLQLVKRLNSESRGTKKCIFYAVDSIEWGHRVTTFLRRHVDLNVNFLTSPQNNNISSSHVLIYYHDFRYSKFAQDIVRTIIGNLAFVIHDDCAHSVTEHPMKEIVHMFLSADQDLRSIGLTSTLVPHCVEIDDIYAFFVRMEKTLHPIVTSHDCDVVNKYLAAISFKRVRYTLPEKWIARTDASIVNQSIDYLYSLIKKLKYNDTERQSIGTRLKTILDDFKKVADIHGLYPSFIAAGLSRIALERVKLLCSNNSLLVAVSAIIGEFNMISAWLSTAIQGSGCLKDVAVVKAGCDVKITKTWSLLSKMGREKNCVIFVKDTITAHMLTHVLREVSGPENEKSLEIGCVTIDGSSQNFESVREELYEKKNARKVLKRFLERSLKVLVVTWNASRLTAEQSADCIFYFDLPPDYISYVISLKYGNAIQCEHYFFVEGDDANTESMIQPFADLSVALREVLLKKNILNEDEFRKIFRTARMTEEKLTAMFPTLSIRESDFYSAISIVNKYCESLPTDAFTRVAPRWTIEKNDGQITCRLQLPVEPSNKCVAEIEPIKDMMTSKQIAALQMIQTLKELRHLDDEMLPQIHHLESDSSFDKVLFPMWKDERDDYEAGTAHCCRIFPLTFPEWFYDSAPQPDSDCYVHVISLNPVEEPVGTDSRKHFFHDLLKSREEFAIVTGKMLPNICQFPVFNDMGQVDVSIKVNALKTRLTEEQIDKLFSFHRFIFLDVLKVVRRFMVADRSRKDSSFLVAPVRIDDEGAVQFAWDVTDNAYFNEVVIPSDKVRICTDFISQKYIGAVITPWYRVLPQRNYVVTKVVKEVSPTCSFSSDDYQTYSSYYLDKYGIEVKQPIQPLLEARAIPNNLNCVRPRAQTSRDRRKLGEKETDFDEVLLPELCVRQPFPAVYWYKSVLLLAITHRLHYILVAETIRQRVTSHDQCSTQPETSPTTDEDDVLRLDIDCLSKYNEPSSNVVAIASVLKDVKRAKRVRRYPWARERLPVDVDRNLSTANLLEVMLQHDFMRKPDQLVDPYPGTEHSGIPETLKPIEVFPRYLTLERELSPGPKQSDIYQAFTLKDCGDVVNLKSLKLVGSSFLKFAASLLLYRRYSNLNVQQLRHLRGKLIGKRNLSYCGSKLQLGSCLKLHDVNLDYDWNFGGFSVPEEVRNAISESGIWPEVIFNLEIPNQEQATGVLSANTRNELQQKLLNYFNETNRQEANFPKTDGSPTGDNNNHVLLYFKKQCVPDKLVVDVLEALAGVYLENCGVEGGLKFLQYVQVIESDLALRELFVAHSGASDPQELYRRVFVTRQFETMPVFVQAFTHHSCYPESAHECHDKLVFLGGALLDFLLTTYIFENRTPEMSFTDFEDVRIALVSDVLFAVVLVRAGLHKHLLVQSPTLVEKIDKFVTQQERVRHEVNEHEYLFLVEETSHQISERVDVPKILSDTFKALMAAVFVQTADLKHVWRICYSLMQSEIDTFMHNAPRNPVRLLAETDLAIRYEKSKSHEYDPILRVVDMSVEIDKKNFRFTGVGESTQQAKLIAAKLALKSLSKNFTL